MVPAHGKLDLTIQSVESIYRFTSHPFHLIVVDDSDPKLDATPAYFERFCKTHKNITYIHSDVPYTCGNQFFNIAIKNMETKYLATVMNSIKVQPKWDVEAVKLMDQDAKIGCIGFKCLFPEADRIECAGIQLFAGYVPIDIGKDLPATYLTESYEVQAIQWAFALLRKEAVEGNLDETIFNGFKGWDDIDNCFVLKNKGWKIWYCGFGVGVHQPRATRGDNTPDGYLKNKQNGRTFYKRWGLWNNYMESKKMDVGEKLSAETKKNLSAIITEWQMLKILFESRNQTLQVYTRKALVDELKVDPTQYVLAADPAHDVWDLKMKSEVEVPKNGDGAKSEKDDLEGQFKARREAMAANATPVVVKDNLTPSDSMATEGS